ncbi:hypothetical protein GCM10023330_05470 [Litoribaculum gwangyangense]|uniref:Uncharacterized protein n=1 Tax=Litoribaculum gwangyangense TaxID=1130722 RepID=A0ABP9BY89_9FLAO
MAIPGEYFLDLPAKIYVIGKIGETPIPTRQKPMIALQKFGNKIANKIPKEINIPLKIYMLGIPNLSNRLSIKNLDVVMHIINNKYP